MLKSYTGQEIPVKGSLSVSVDFLGHRVDAEGIHTKKDKLQAIVQAPAPKNV